MLKRLLLACKTDEKKYLLGKYGLVRASCWHQLATFDKDSVDRHMHIKEWGGSLASGVGCLMQQTSLLMGDQTICIRRNA